MDDYNSDMIVGLVSIQDLPIYQKSFDNVKLLEISTHLRQTASISCALMGLLKDVNFFEISFSKSLKISWNCLRDILKYP